MTFKPHDNNFTLATTARVIGKMSQLNSHKKGEEATPKKRFPKNKKPYDS